MQIRNNYDIVWCKGGDTAAIIAGEMAPGSAPETGTGIFNGDLGTILRIDTENELIRENYDINRRFCPNFKGPSNGIDFSKEAFADYFEGDFIVVEFGNDLIYDENAFISRCLSSSYAPKPDKKNYNEYVAELQKLFKKYNQNGTVPYPYITRCYIGKV